MLNAGQLFNRGVVKQRSTTLQTRGQPTDTWEEVCVIRHSMAQISGNESDVANMHHAVARYELKCWYTPKVKEKHRIYTRDKVLEIESVDNIEMKNRALRLVCSEVKS